MVFTRKSRKSSYKDVKNKSKRNRSIRLHIGRCPNGGKLQFADEATAKKQAKNARKHIGAKMIPYPCVYCLRWHIGHSRPLEVRIQRRLRSEPVPENAPRFRKLAKRADLDNDPNLLKA